MKNFLTTWQQNIRATFKPGLIFRLFLVCSFPIHLWSIIFILQDIGWVSERTNFLDALGYASYSLLFAFGESLLALLIALTVGLFAVYRWKGEKWLAVLASLYLMVLLWQFALQYFFYLKRGIPELDQVIVYKLTFGGPWITQVLLVIVFYLLVAASVVLPLYLIEKNDWFEAVNSAIDKIVPLAVFYLVFDLAGLLFLVYRYFAQGVIKG